MARRLIQAPNPEPQWEVNTSANGNALLPEGNIRCRWTPDWTPESFVPFPPAHALTRYGHEVGVRPSPCRVTLMPTWLVPSRATCPQSGWHNTIASGVLFVALVCPVGLGSTRLADLKPAQTRPDTCKTLGQERMASLPSRRSTAATLQPSDESLILPDTPGARPLLVPCH